MSKRIETIIIGAGPAGLAIAGSLRKKGISFEIFEQSSYVGKAWRNHYDRLHLHTVKKLSHLPHLPFPEHYPQYASRQQVVNYLEQYADHFDIRPHFNVSVKNISKKVDFWEIQMSDGQVCHSPHVVIATGVNRLPKSPSWPGQENFKGKVLHSTNYKNVNDVVGENILVIGMGNTGAELALDLAEQKKRTFISVRSAVSIIPRDINGRPTQLTAKLLEKLPFGSGEWLGNVVRKLVVGNLSKYGIQEPALSPAKQIKMTGKTPVLDIGTVKHIKAGNIKVIPDIASFYDLGVVTKDGVKWPIDSIVLATGYRAGIEDFLQYTEGLFDQYGVPKDAIGKEAFNGLYFIGFDNYKLGGILGTVRTDAKLISEEIEKRRK